MPRVYSRSEVEKATVTSVVQDRYVVLQAAPEYPRECVTDKMIWHQCQKDECQIHAPKKIEAWMKFKLHHEEKLREQKQKTLLAPTAEPSKAPKEPQNSDNTSGGSKQEDLTREDSSDDESSHNDDPTPREFTGHPRRYAGWMDHEAARQNRATRRWLEKKAGNARRRL